MWLSSFFAYNVYLYTLLFSLIMCIHFDDTNIYVRVCVCLSLSVVIMNGITTQELLFVTNKKIECVFVLFVCVYVCVSLSGFPLRITSQQNRWCLWNQQNWIRFFFLLVCMCVSLSLGFHYESRTLCVCLSLWVAPCVCHTTTYFIERETHPALTIATYSDTRYLNSAARNWRCCVHIYLRTNGTL